MKAMQILCTRPKLQVSKPLYQKKRDVHIISARNSGAGNGCADFMGASHFLVLSAGNPHAHKIPPFRGGGC